MSETLSRFHLVKLICALPKKKRGGGGREIEWSSSNNKERMTLLESWPIWERGSFIDLGYKTKEKLLLKTGQLSTASGCVLTWLWWEAGQKGRLKWEDKEEERFQHPSQGRFLFQLCLRGRGEWAGVWIRLIDFIAERRWKLWCLPGCEQSCQYL